MFVTIQPKIFQIVKKGVNKLALSIFRICAGFYGLLKTISMYSKDTRITNNFKILIRKARFLFVILIGVVGLSILLTKLVFLERYTYFQFCSYL